MINQQKDYMMHIDDVKAMQERKEELMRKEGHHVPPMEHKHDKDNWGGMHGVDPNSHGVELQ